MTREGCVVLSDPAQVNSVLPQFPLRDVPITANHHDGLAVCELVLHDIISIVLANGVLNLTSGVDDKIRVCHGVPSL